MKSKSQINNKIKFDLKFFVKLLFLLFILYIAYKLWRIEYNQVLIEYLQVFLSFPSVILIIFLIFIDKFSGAIDYFIRNMKVKYRDIEASSQQTTNFNAAKGVNAPTTKSNSSTNTELIEKEFEKLKFTSDSKQKEIEQLKKWVVFLLNRSEFFEFQYLNQFLAEHTKIALLFLNQEKRVTKELFMQKIYVPENISDKNLERAAVLNALITNELVQEKNSVISISEKGEKYLDFIGVKN